MAIIQEPKIETVDSDNKGAVTPFDEINVMQIRRLFCV